MKEYLFRINQAEKALLQNGLVLLSELLGDPDGRIAKLIERLQSASGERKECGG